MKDFCKMFLPFVALLAATLFSFAQNEPQIKIVFLTNHTITDVNFNPDQFNNYMIRLSEKIHVFLSKESVSRDLTIQVHIKNDSLPDFQIAARPAFSNEEMEKIQGTLRSVKAINTRIVDFVFAYEIEANGGCSCPDSAYQPEIYNPYLMKESAFIKASLSEKVLLLKDWSSVQVLPVLTAFARQADEQFIGVRMTGSRFAKIRMDSVIDVKNYTDRDEYYWRAMMEMEPNNFLIISMKIFLHVAAGEFDLARRYTEILSFFKHDKTIADYYLDELMLRLSYFYDQLNKEVATGIEMHEAMRYQDAVEHYRYLLEQYPASAWLHYELFHSQQEMNFRYDSNYEQYQEAWLEAKSVIYGFDPLFSLSVSAHSKEDAYLTMRRNAVLYLFNVKEKKHGDFLELADISLDLREYVLAAHLYWLALSHFSKKDLGKRNILAYYLFALDNANVKEIPLLFQMDYDKEFRKIKKSLRKKMEDLNFRDASD